ALSRRGFVYLLDKIASLRNKGISTGSGRDVGPKCVTPIAASSTSLGSSQSNSDSAIEQQISALWNAGWIAFFAATTPPTQIAPAGQASGITAPASIVGSFMMFDIVSTTAFLFAFKNSLSSPSSSRFT